MSNDRTYCYLRRRVWSRRGRTRSEILTLYLHILLCRQSSRSLISLCSNLAADQNKLWPTFRELPLSSSPPGSQGVPQGDSRKREVKSVDRQPSHVLGDIKPHIRPWFPLWRRLRKGLGEGSSGGFSVSEHFLYLNVSEGEGVAQWCSACLAYRRS